MKFLMTILFALSVAAPSLADVATPPVPTFNKVTATVFVGMGVGHGSGFFIAPDVVVTAKHVVSQATGFEEGNPDYKRMYVETYDGIKYNIKSVVVSEKHDVALVLLDKPVDKIVPAKVDCRFPETGETLIHVGSPGHIRWLTTPIFVGGTDEGMILLVGDGILGGVSGGPLFDKDDEVVGIITQGMDIRIPGFADIPSGIGRGVPATAICHLIDTLHKEAPRS
jgi:S1-C subfamily serine protease